MEIVWVLENVIQSKKFYNRLQILLLIASVSLWRKYHPNHYTVLYCDKLTYITLYNAKLLGLWHSVRPLSYNVNIRKKVFWSSSKSKVISETDIPIVVVDHDFLIFKNIDKHLNTNILYSFDEIASNWYPNKNCAFNKKLTNPVERIVDRAANVSLLYLPDPEFAKKYGKQVLKNHEEFTKMGIKDTNYMILSEQLMLKQWIEKEKIEYKLLNKNVHDNSTLKFTDNINNKGIWYLKESSLYYLHLGPEEKRIRKNKEDSKELMSYLYRCIKAGKLINVNDLKIKMDEFRL